MSWYLQHYFDPDMDHLRLKPANGSGASADLYNLGYVQNVVTGQVLAQVMPLESVPTPDPRFILQDPILPVGPNTRIDPEHSTYLLATSNGYVFYYNGLITVKKLLNVRSDVSFQTGNIFFVGDMAVHGSVRAGFEVQANNVLIKGMVEGGSVRARRDIAIIGGARGGAGHHCMLDAGGTLRSSFLEKVETRARGNIMVEKYCLHSTVYAGANVVIQGRAYGCTINAYGALLVNEQLGNMAAVPTRIFLGYDPMRIRQLEKIDAQMGVLSETITHLTAVAGHLPPDANPTTRKLAICMQNRDHLLERRATLWESLHTDEQAAEHCRLLVRGKVFPGVEVAIGRAFMTVEKPMTDVIFYLEQDEVVVRDAPPARTCCA